MTNSSEILEACAAYLKEQGGADRLMRAFRGKYKGLGKVGGTVVLHHPTELEIQLLRGLMGLDAAGKSQCSISLARFEKAFSRTRFDGVTLEGLLGVYFEESLTSAREDQEQRKDQRRSYFEELGDSLRSEALKEWVLASVCDPSSYAQSSRLLLVLEKESQSALTEQIMTLDRILGMLALEQPRTHIALPNLASDACGDPHGLDQGRPLEKLLVSYLSDYYSLPLPKSAEEKAALYDQAGILQDPGSRTLMVYGLKAWGKGWERFYEHGEVLTLNLTNLSGVTRILPAEAGPVQEEAGPAQREAGPVQVFCYENPAVFYDHIHHHPRQGAICTSGQLSQTAWILMQRLTESGVTICYSGDYDPEGLLIADKLKSRFGDKVQLVGYTPELYHQALSQNPISDKRLRQLDRLQTPELIHLADHLRTKKLAGYQETIRSQLIENLRVREDLI